MKKVIWAYLLLSASATYAEEQLLLGSGCYTQGAMREIVQLSDADGMMLMFQYLEEGICAPTVTTVSDWEAGPKIRDTGVKAAYARVYNWTGGIDGPLPSKHVMYFDASIDRQSRDSDE